MNISYKNKTIQKYAENEKFCVKQLGKAGAKRLHQRLEHLYYAENLEEVRNLPGNYHELTGNRKGQWACTITGNKRLVFEPHEEPIPTNEHGQYIWIEIKGVELIEVVDYH